ncbi:hypothetical protein FRX31_029360, partial [Thalictrum thalictroides]
EEDSEGATPDNQAVVLDIGKSATITSKLVSAAPQAISNSVDIQKDTFLPRRVEIEENIVDLTVNVKPVDENHEDIPSHDDKPDESDGSQEDSQDEAIMKEDLHLALVPHASTQEGNLSLETDFPLSLLLMEGTESYEEKEDHEVTYGSDSELLKKNKKSIPPLSMQTRSRVGGLSSSSKKGFQCCKDC